MAIRLDRPIHSLTTARRYHFALRDITAILNASSLWHWWVGPGYLSKFTKTVCTPDRVVVKVQVKICSNKAKFKRKLCP